MVREQSTRTRSWYVRSKSRVGAWERKLYSCIAVALAGDGSASDVCGCGLLRKVDGG